MTLEYRRITFMITRHRTFNQNVFSPAQSGFHALQRNLIGYYILVPWTCSCNLSQRNQVVYSIIYYITSILWQQCIQISKLGQWMGLRNQFCYHFISASLKFGSRLQHGYNQFSILSFKALGDFQCKIRRPSNVICLYITVAVQ